MADDPSPDWRLLAPHRPLSPGDDAYVPRPANGGDAIAAWVVAGGTTVLVNGPTGVGKSTELAQAARALQSSRAACLVQVDRMANMHRLSADRLMQLITQRLVAFAREELHLPVSDDLTLAPTGLSDEQPFQISGLGGVRVAVAEIARLSQQERVALLIDGLEKLLPGPGAREIFDALSQLPELVDLVVVIPWHAALGGGTEPILRAGERLHHVTALDTSGPEAGTTAEFFARVIARRLRNIASLPEPIFPLLARAFKSSGGILRVYLQLMADAGTYARVKRGADWPDGQDLSDAIADQEASFRRALLRGDTKAITAVLNTDGRELDIERRVRLLAQGIVLERIRDGRVSLEVHPLAAKAISDPQS